MNTLRKILTQDGFLTERIDVHQNALLGDYDQSGKYFICQEIIAELMAMPKIKKSVYNNSMFCYSNNLGIGELVFEVHYDKKVKNGFATSKIYILENVYKVNGYYSNTIKTEIGEYNDTVQDYMDKSYSYYNIKLTDDDGREEIVDLRTLPYPYIMAKRKYENALFRRMDDDIQDIYGEILKEKQTILKEADNDFGKDAINIYEEELRTVQDRFLTTKDDDKPKAYSELMDKATEDIVDTNEKYKDGASEYYQKLHEVTAKSAEKYEAMEETAKRKTAKHLSRDESKRVETINDRLEERNASVSKDKAWNKGYREEVVAGVEPIADSERIVDVNEQEQSAKEVKAKGNTMQATTKEAVRTAGAGVTSASAFADGKNPEWMTKEEPKNRRPIENSVSNRDLDRKQSQKMDNTRVNNNINTSAIYDENLTKNKQKTAQNKDYDAKQVGNNSNAYREQSETHLDGVKTADNEQSLESRVTALERETASNEKQNDKQKSISDIGKGLQNLANKANNPNSPQQENRKGLFATFEQELFTTLAEKSLDVVETVISNGIVQGMQSSAFMPDNTYSKLLQAGIDMIKDVNEIGQTISNVKEAIGNDKNIIDRMHEQDGRDM